MTQVTETLAYYSMLRRKPAGKFHIQVCTNISCMLRGGQELYEHVQKRLGIGNKQVSQTGTFSLEEVECIGACTGAPAMQVLSLIHIFSRTKSKWNAGCAAMPLRM